MTEAEKFKHWLETVYRNGNFHSSTQYVTGIHALNVKLGWDGNGIFDKTDITELAELEDIVINLPSSTKDEISHFRAFLKFREIENVSRRFTPENFEALSNFQYTAETFGQSTIEREGSATYNRIHGIVVGALEKELKGKKLLIGNDTNRDLYIHNNKTITTLFEIKTSSSTQNLYTAVGQLLIYSIPAKENINLIIVLPDKLNEIVEKRLESFGIKPLYYKWENEQPVFAELDEII